MSDKAQEGPWRVLCYHSSGTHYTVVRGNGRDLARFHDASGWTLQKDDAHLIAAAPELLAALAAIVISQWWGLDGNDEQSDRCFTRNPLEKMARNAISRALGKEVQ